MLKYHMYQASSVTCDNEHENMQIQLVLCGIEIDRALHRYANLRDQSLSESLESTKYPKNVILFIGDGMSLPTVTAARILKGQKYLNVSGEEQYLTWERFPESALLKVRFHKTNYEFD